MFFPTEIWRLIRDFAGSYSHNIECILQKLKTRRLLELIKCTFEGKPPKMTTGGCNKRTLGKIEYKNELIKFYMSQFNSFGGKLQEKIFARSIKFINGDDNEWPWLFARSNSRILKISNRYHKVDDDD
jgi:hypothetical protein